MPSSQLFDSWTTSLLTLSRWWMLSETSEAITLRYARPPSFIIANLCFRIWFINVDTSSPPCLMSMTCTWLITGYSHLGFVPLWGLLRPWLSNESTSDWKKCAAPDLQRSFSQYSTTTMTFASATNACFGASYLRFLSIFKDQWYMLGTLSG